MNDSKYTVVFPGYTIGKDAYEVVKQVCPRYGKKVVVIGGKTAIAKAEDKLIEAVEGIGLEFTGFLLYGGEASYENVHKLSQDQAVEEADMIFAVGGGKAIDTAKVLAHTLNLPFFTFPTVASNCAAFTSLAVMYYPDGRHKEISFSNIPPVHVFMCTRIAVEAPKSFLWAGMGDTIAKYYEANISARGDSLKHSDGLGVVISTMCAAPILQYGAQALLDNEKKVTSAEFEEVMLAIVVSTGMVSNFVQQDFNGHIAHALFCELTTLPQIEAKHLHGEVVMYGVLVLLMCDQQLDDLKRVYEFCKSVALPTKLADIDIKIEELDMILESTAKSAELVHSPYPVSKKMLQDAVQALEDYNKK